MTQIVLSIAQIRRWTNPQNWMVNGYSSTQDVFYFPASQQQLQLVPGGWTLSSVDLLRINWDGPAHKECMYMIQHNGDRAYRGLWTPKLGETITESFFRDGDLWVINYRLLKVTEEWIDAQGNLLDSKGNRLHTVEKGRE